MGRALGLSLSVSLGLSLGLSLGFASPARADQLVLTPIADTTLIEDPTGSLSLGAATYFFAGRVGNNGGGTRRRAALRFDLAAIPPGSTITSVSLRMYCSADGLTSSFPISLKRFAKGWGEGASFAFGGGGAPSETNDATWVHRFYPTAQTWTTPGGDFAITASATRNVTVQGSYTWDSTAALVADVQGWVNNPSTNFGWCVQGNETTLQSVKRFDSREASVPANRPQLTIVYTPAPPNPYDLNGDYKVNASDLATLLARWGLPGAGDFDGSGGVDAGDLASLLSAWTG